MDHETFARWLADYGAAWETRDLEATTGAPHSTVILLYLYLKPREMSQAHS